MINAPLRLCRSKTPAKVAFSLLKKVNSVLFDIIYIAFDEKYSVYDINCSLEIPRPSFERLTKTLDNLYFDRLLAAVFKKSFEISCCCPAKKLLILDRPGPKQR